MKQIAHVMAICMLAAALASCNQASAPAITNAASTAAAAPSMLTDISGVWRASDGTMVSIVYDEKKAPPPLWRRRDPCASWRNR